MQIENFCRRCGIELEKEPNRCSEGKQELCKTMIFNDEDRYCSICGSPTNYWKEQMEEVNAEKEKLQAEREASVQMMAELQALKLQLERQHLAGNSTEGAKRETASEGETQETTAKDEQ